mgnify:CR=1 FL=1
MQWNKVNISKDELKRRQDKYIKEAIEISKKSRISVLMFRLTAV